VIKYDPGERNEQLQSKSPEKMLSAPDDLNKDHRGNSEEEIGERKIIEDDQTFNDMGRKKRRLRKYPEKKTRNQERFERPWEFKNAWDTTEVSHQVRIESRSRALR
jgi:hypothetical protein